MKLLFDENLSPRLCASLLDLFPGSRHVDECGFRSADDGRIWDFAKQEGFTVISKDSDFYHRAVLYGSPPKVVWLRAGNCRTSHLGDLLRRHYTRLKEFLGNEESALVLARVVPGPEQIGS